MDKPKSKVNAAGVYTKPAMRKALTTRELAERLSVSTRTIQAWRDTGKLPHIRLTARSFRYVWEQVELWLAGKIIDAL